MKTDIKMFHVKQKGVILLQFLLSQQEMDKQVLLESKEKSLSLTIPLE